MSKQFGIQKDLNVVVCDDPHDAVNRGFVYADLEPIEIKRLVIVRNGMVSGAATVDLILHDQNGKEFVMMLPVNVLTTALALAG